MDYRIFSAGQEQVGGILAMTPEMLQGGRGRAGWAKSRWTTSMPRSPR